MLRRCCVCIDGAQSHAAEFPPTWRLHAGWPWWRPSAARRISPRPWETQRRGRCHGRCPPRWQPVGPISEAAGQEVPPPSWSWRNLRRNHPLPPECVETENIRLEPWIGFRGSGVLPVRKVCKILLPMHHKRALRQQFLKWWLSTQKWVMELFWLDLVLVGRF